jgi:tetratricopeptide (TPR) repeat protein
MILGFFLILLIALCVLSIRLAYSGDVAGQTWKGWILLLFILVLTIEVIGTWIYLNPDPFNTLFAGLFGALIFGSQCPLLLELIGQTVAALRTKNLKIIEVYSEAEALAAQNDLPGAIREYQRIVAEKPEDLDPLFRMADLMYQNGDHLKSAGAYQRILEHPQELGVERHCATLTRLSELYANQLGDVEKARGFVRTIIKEHPDTRYAKYAASRLRNM